MVILYATNKLESRKEEMPLSDFSFRTPLEFPGAISYAVTAWIIKNIRLEKNYNISNRFIECSPSYTLIKSYHIVNNSLFTLEREIGPFFIVYKNKKTVDEDVPLCTADVFEHAQSKRLIIYTPVFNNQLQICK